MIRVGKYIKNLTETDAITIAESVFGSVENVVLNNSKNGAKILQFETKGKVCRYEIRDFGLKSVSPRQASHSFNGRAYAENLAEMYRAYISFMKTARYENGQLRFPDFEQDLNATYGLGL